MDKVLQEIIKKAKKDKKVLAVALFGSTARGEKHPRDIDVCIFLKPGEFVKDDLFDIQLKYTPCSEKYDVQVFQALPLYIQEEIMNDAKFLFVKNEDAMYDLLYYAQKQCNDLKGYFKEYLEVVLYGT